MNNKQHKKSYAKPKLSFLGGVEKLTLNSDWNSSSYSHTLVKYDDGNDDMS